MVTLEERIERARGEKPVDLLLKNVQLVNVFSGEIYKDSIAIYHSRVVGIGDDYDAEQVVDCDGLYAAPGFIDGHMHLESCMVTVREFARAVVPRGTTTVIADPHEIANVLGIDGIRFILESSKYNPLNVYIMLPSCVPATDNETSGARLRAFDLMPFLNEKWVLGIGEMMNYPGVVNRAPEVMDKMKIPGEKRVDGHCPGLHGKDLSAYISAGIYSDHECTTQQEALEKLRKGMFVMIREGSASKNLDDLIGIVTPENSRRCFFATDDRHPEDLINQGHIDYLVRRSIELGVEPVTALRMASLNAAEYFRIPDIGAIAPGYRADIVLFQDLKKIDVCRVYKGGKLVAESGKLTGELPQVQDIRIRGSVNIKWLEDSDFEVPAEGRTIRIIEVIPGQIVTGECHDTALVKEGKVVADPARDIAKLVVVERHTASDNIGVAFVRGFGIRKGALASSVAHDSHNIVVVGVEDADIFKAITSVRKYQGGIVAVEDGELKGVLPLPIAGLISDKPLSEVNVTLMKLHETARQLGVTLSDPFMHLSFLSLSVIPKLKLTDRGLFDVEKFDFVSLFLD